MKTIWIGINEHSITPDCAKIVQLDRQQSRRVLLHQSLQNLKELTPYIESHSALRWQKDGRNGHRSHITEIFDDASRNLARCQSVWQTVTQSVRQSVIQNVRQNVGQNVAAKSGHFTTVLWLVDDTLVCTAEQIILFNCLMVIIMRPYTLLAAQQNRVNEHGTPLIKINKTTRVTIKCEAQTLVRSCHYESTSLLPWRPAIDCMLATHR